METKSHQWIKNNKVVLDNKYEKNKWKRFKVRENLNLKLQIEGLRKSLEEQLKGAAILNCVELSPENIDEDEVFNDRLEYLEGKLAGNYGKAEKQNIEKVYGDSKPVFKYAEINDEKPQKSQVIDEVSEIITQPDMIKAANEDSLTQIILLNEQTSLTKEHMNTLSQMPVDTFMVLPYDYFTIIDNGQLQ